MARLERTPPPGASDVAGSPQRALSPNAARAAPSRGRAKMQLEADSVQQDNLQLTEQSKALQDAQQQLAHAAEAVDCDTRHDHLSGLRGEPTRKR